MKQRHVLLLGLVILAWVFKPYSMLALQMVQQKAGGKKTIQDRIKEFSDVVEIRLIPHFKRSGIPYPPAYLAFVGLKHEKSLEVYAAAGDEKYRFIRAYPILAASGKLGPKLQEGDRQVPEGLYRIESLNPNSLYHLSLRVNYPNDFDRSQARKDGRTNLGGDIMIHGNAVSIGCLAMGNEAAEDLFVLAALTGIKNIHVLFSPVDFRVRLLPALSDPTSKWTGTLHTMIKEELVKYKKGA